MNSRWGWYRGQWSKKCCCLGGSTKFSSCPRTEETSLKTPAELNWITANVPKKKISSFSVKSSFSLNRWFETVHSHEREIVIKTKRFRFRLSHTLSLYHSLTPSLYVSLYHSITLSLVRAWEWEWVRESEWESEEERVRENETGERVSERVSQRGVRVRERESERVREWEWEWESEWVRVRVRERERREWESEKRNSCR